MTGRCYDGCQMGWKGTTCDAGENDFIILYFSFTRTCALNHLKSRSNINVYFYLLIFTECEGTFGDNCSNSCGFCFGKEHCHPLNGTCMNGCDSGYKGQQCTQSMMFILKGYRRKINNQNPSRNGFYQTLIYI